MVEDQVPQILANLPHRISDVAKPWAESTPDHPALVEAAGTWTYRELDHAVTQTQSWLKELGIGPGDRVMLVCENCRAFAAILFALAEIDAWPVLVNARLSEREIDEIREHCGARRIFYTTAVSPHAAEHARRHGASFQDTELLGPLAVGGLNLKVDSEPVLPAPAERLAAMIYTSGTTGVPKGVMLSHRNLLFIAAISARLRALGRDDRVYGVLPMSHAVGLSVVLLGSLLSGATLYMAPRFDPMGARTAIEKDRLTVVLGSPAMFLQFLNYAKLRHVDALRFPGLRIISASGAPLHPETKTQVEKLFGMILHNGYGVTECSPTIAQTRVDAPRADTSVGPVFPGVEIRLLGPERNPVLPGEVGELQVRGPNIMQGYYRAPLETAAAIDPDGWFNTRDLARLHDGSLYIVGRTKELIVHSGFNVYPAEVEAVFNAHPAVVQSAVIGRVVEGDEQVVAFVQLVTDSPVTLGELAEYAARSLSPYKRPSQIFLLPAMPVTLTGKIVKAELANMAASTVQG